MPPEQEGSQPYVKELRWMAATTTEKSVGLDAKALSRVETVENHDQAENQQRFTTTLMSSIAFSTRQAS